MIPSTLPTSGMRAPALRVLVAALATACIGNAAGSVILSAQQSTQCLVNAGGTAALGACATGDVSLAGGTIKAGSGCLTLQKDKPLTFAACTRNDDQQWTLEGGHLRSKTGLCAEASGTHVTAQACGGAGQGFVRGDLADAGGAAGRLSLGAAGKAQLAIVDAAARGGAALGPGGTWIGVGDLAVAALGGGRYVIVPSGGNVTPAKAGSVMAATAGAHATVSEDGTSITTGDGPSLRLSPGTVSAAGGAGAVRAQLMSALGLNAPAAAPAVAVAAPKPAAAPPGPAVPAPVAPPPAVPTPAIPAVVAAPAGAPPAALPGAAAATAPVAVSAAGATAPSPVPLPQTTGHQGDTTAADRAFATAPAGFAPIKIGDACVTVQAAQSGAAVNLGTCRGSPAQQFRLQGTELMVNLKAQAKSLCLDAGAGNEGDLVTAQTCTGGDGSASRPGRSWSASAGNFAVTSTGRLLAGLTPSPTSKVAVRAPDTGIADDDKLGKLDAFDAGASLLREALQMADIADSLAQAMQVAAGVGLLDRADADDAVGAVRAARALLNGGSNPYSLAKLVAGTAIAMDDEDRRAFNTMIAEDGLIERVREAKATLVASRRAGEGDALAFGSSFLERSTAEIPSSASLYLYTDPKQRLTVDGNDRAQTLIAILTFGRALNTTTTFAGGLTLFEQTASSFVEASTGQLEKLFKNPKLGLTPLEEHVMSKRITKFATTYTAAKLATLLSIAAMNAMAVTTPTSISRVYMTIGNRPYVPNAPPWPLKTGEANQVIGKVYVVPRTSDAQVITPLGIIGSVVDVAALGGMGKFIAQYKVNATMTAAIDSAMKKAKTTWGLISHTQLDNMLNAASGKSWLPGWLNSAQNYFTFKAKDLPGVEINDTRVVSLSVTGGGDHISLIPGQQWIVRGVSAGSTGVRGQLTERVAPLYASTGSSAGERFFVIAINVIDAQQPIQPWAPCGKPGDGGIMSPYTGKCEYPT